MTLIIYFVVCWVGIGVILAKDSITEVENVYLGDSWAFVLVALVAPFMVLMNLYESHKPIILFKKKETND